MQDQNASEEASLAEDVRDLGNPVHAGCIIELGSEITHAQDEDERQHEEHGCQPLLHEKSGSDHAVLDSSEADDLHDDENQIALVEHRGYGQSRGGPEVLLLQGSKSEEDQDEAGSLHREERSIQCLEVADVQGNEELPGCLVEASDEHHYRTCGQKCKGALDQFVVQISLQNDCGNEEQHHGDEVHDCHRYRYSVHLNLT